MSAQIRAATCVLAMSVAIVAPATSCNRTDNTLVRTAEPQWEAVRRAADMPADASTTLEVVVFSDYECTFCRTLHEVLTELRASYADDVAIGVVHFPLRGHRFAVDAARAAECARRQGAFESYERELFAWQDAIGTRDWTEYARRAHVADVRSFEVCLTDGITTSTVFAHRALGDGLGIDGTPTVFIDGDRLNRPPTLAELIAALRDARAHARTSAGR